MAGQFLSGDTANDALKPFGKYRLSSIPSLAATLPLGAEALHSGLAWALAGTSFAVLAFTEVDTLLVVLAASAMSLAAFAIGITT